MTYEKRNFMSKFYVLLIMLYLYVPIIVLMVMGFNKSRYNSMPFEFTTEWYQALSTDSALQQAALNSVLLALVTGVVCVLLATLFILGERYFQQHCNDAYEYTLAYNGSVASSAYKIF